MNLLELKKQIDILVKSIKNSDYNNNPEKYTVSLRTNDAAILPMTGIKRMDLGFDWEANHLMIDAQDKIYTNYTLFPVKTTDLYYKSRTKFCYVDCKKDDCECKTVYEEDCSKTIYGIFIDNVLTLPLYMGENNAMIGLQSAVNDFNEKCETLNEALNYDKYYDYVSNRNKRFYIGGLDNKSTIELREIPTHGLNNVIKNAPY